MKKLITYSSRTGNTKKLCEYVYNNLQNKQDVEFIEMNKVENISVYEKIVIGFWIDRATANGEAKKFIKKISNKKIAFLATLGARPDSEHADRCRKNVMKLYDNSNDYNGIVLARGKVDPKFLKAIKLLPLPKDVKEKMFEASYTSREPNEKELNEALNFIEDFFK